MSNGPPWTLKGPGSLRAYVPWALLRAWARALKGSLGHLRAQNKVGVLFLVHISIHIMGAIREPGPRPSKEPRGYVQGPEDPLQGAPLPTKYP